MNIKYSKIKKIFSQNTNTNIDIKSDKSYCNFRVILEDKPAEIYFQENKKQFVFRNSDTDLEIYHSISKQNMYAELQNFIHKIKVEGHI